MFIEIQIDANKKSEILTKLNKLYNISAKTIYPDDKSAFYKDLYFYLEESF